MRKHSILLVSVLLSSVSAWAGDWPMYRGDAGRTGYTAEHLSNDLAPQWVYESRQAPRPAWRGEDTRMPFDRAFQPVVAGGLVCFGSSVDHKVYAIDAATGEPRWTFMTDGPVRFAPVAWRDRLFVVSDDGMLYCLSCSDGRVLWQKRGGSEGDRVLGNGRMISRWPVRGGPVVKDDILYFAAGIWPTEGIYIYALNAETGDVIWLNDSSGGIEMDQPHPTARAKSGVSAQGYLVVNDDTLFVPTGRAVPAAFDRDGGAFRYFHLQANGRYGGAAVLADDTWLFNRNSLYRANDGEAMARDIPAASTALCPEFVICAIGSQIRAVDRAHLLVEVDAVNRKGKPIKKTVLGEPDWTIDSQNPIGTSLIVAGDVIVAGGGDANGAKVTAFNIASKSMSWSHDVEGLPYGLAVADGRLYVSTDQGRIYCFGRPVNQQVKVIREPEDPSPYGRNAEYAAMAKAIIQQAGMTEGYCLDLGCGDGGLAFELARQTDLTIYAMDPDPRQVRSARAKLDAAGLYGTRVTVHQGALDKTRYPRYFADLIVSARSASPDAKPLPDHELKRLQRPFGGVVCVGGPGEIRTQVRGAIQGSGTWTHQYCDAANTCCSTDTRARGPLGMLWFDDMPVPMPNRHGRGPAPLVSNGRIIAEGLNGLCAINAYNGRHLWNFEMKGVLKPYHQEHLVGTAVTGSNFCMEGDTIWVHREDRCLGINAETGQQRVELKAPLRPDGRAGTWGYLACVDGTIFGSLVNEEHIVRHAFLKSDMGEQFSESLLVFALDVATGRLKWTYAPDHSIRHNAIAVGANRVYLVDRPMALRDRVGAADQEARHPRGKLIALNAETGRLIWRQGENIFGTMLAMSEKHDVLLMSYQATRFRQTSEATQSMAAFRASTGAPLWSTDMKYISRPILNDDIIYAQPGAWNLLTGEPLLVPQAGSDEKVPWQFSRSYGCGIPACSTHLMVFRSATLGYIDLLRDSGTQNYGGVRPGCWINAIPAGGLVLVPDATDKCTCSYLNKTSVALQPME